ncbi:isocitrate lyase/phosphoenolpyruvate mutase family protein [Lipingzhangella sp. LS1_29]|uniref:Isocitrate lyase/phosphoenolpyruvate mutase family protein n=1 Tax=Lipingzhangella rawalii TaxID=2055835 RepID=A0ABU2H127_9ACTN|nr:isocitrate lyase/phosphoenolpyruvate mutase family protein [Lipingzhangella rawalii]MDS1269008.1 isocitrate lyase/phosphoenolpyruvate mutase family protein [Lipingzhangella rawalii]
MMRTRLSHTLYRLHRAGDPLLLPNAWDFSSAAALAAAGFPAVGTTSLGLAAAHGFVDGTGASRSRTLELAAQLGDLSVPVTVDIEAGFSDTPEGVANLVGHLVDLGIAGINLEDGRDGGVLASTAEQCSRIRAVKERVPDVFVNARTDTRWLEVEPSPHLDETRRRIRAYANAGADGVFVPGVLTAAEIEQLAAAVSVPLNVLYVPDWYSPTQLAQLGVARISTGSWLFRASLAALLAAASRFRGEQDDTGCRVPTYGEVQALVESSHGGAISCPQPDAGPAEAP